MAKSTNKEKLFEDFFGAAVAASHAMEYQLGLNGIQDQFFGVNTVTDTERAKANLRNSIAWHTLSTLYEYAINGVDTGDISSLVIDGDGVLNFMHTEDYYVSSEWFEIVARGDGRLALDEGQIIELYKVALLANVDVRTVRNAISAGKLIAFNAADKDKGDDVLHIDNASARQWLHDRRGFKPTLKQYGNNQLRLADISSPLEFATFLSAQRKSLELDSANGKLVVFHPSVNAQAIDQLEAGVFALPLDTVIPIADFYQVSRKELLECVMRVFFSEELSLLSDTPTNEVA